MKQKPYELAYKDYKKKMSYADIAKKYKVSVATVKSWYTRHWKSMLEQEALNTQTDELCNQQKESIQESLQPEPIKLDLTAQRACFAAVAAKQVQDIQPDKLIAYTIDNLPEIEPRQARFVREYLVDFNQRQAAIRAGYPVSSADTMASRLMSNVKVSAHIQAALAERDRRTSLNQDLIARELAKVLLVNPSKVIDLDTGAIRPEATEDDLAAIQAVKVKVTPTKNGNIVEREVRFVPKDRVLDLAAKVAGMLIERKQVDVHQTVEHMTAEERERRINDLLKRRQETIDIEAE